MKKTLITLAFVIVSYFGFHLLRPLWDERYRNTEIVPREPSPCDKYDFDDLTHYSGTVKVNSQKEIYFKADSYHVDGVNITKDSTVYLLTFCSPHGKENMVEIHDSFLYMRSPYDGGCDISFSGVLKKDTKDNLPMIELVGYVAFKG